MRSKKSLENETTIYLLFSCNQWKEYSSMSIKGVTTDPQVLYVMIGSEIKAGNMLYGFDNAKDSWERFLKDYCEGDITLDMLEYGYVDTFEDYSLRSQELKDEFPKARSVWKALSKSSA